MAARAIVSFILVVLIWQPLPLVGAQSLDEQWAHGRELSRRGDYVGAEQYYASLIDQYGAVAAPHALLLRARIELAEADYSGAEATLLSLLNDYPGSADEPAALCSLALVRKAAGDCSGALRALDAYDAAPGRTALGPYPSLQRAACLTRVGDWSGELAAAKTALAIDGGGPRLTRIEGLERAGEAALKLGRRQEALAFYESSLTLAGTRGYRAEMLFTTATVLHALGRDETDRYRAIVVELPETARAAGALDALNDLGLGGVVSPLQAGTVRLNAHEYSDALALFDQVLDGSPDAVPLTGHGGGAANLGAKTTLDWLAALADHRRGGG